MGKTLSIETGIRCNNRCAFCYQTGWRGPGCALPDPDTKTLTDKLRWGIENGYDSVGFSGGEPTIRRDFLELIRTAVTLGYGRVSLTTNGRRFSNRRFAQDALAAGLSSIGWSLHGPDAAIHDALVGRQGAFRQALAGMRNVADAGRTMGRHVDQNLFTLVNRLNHERLPEVCRIGRSLGIKLMILQPVIYSKANLSLASRFAIPLDVLLDSIRRAARQGLKHEWFVKLFNLPPCFFPDMPEAFEHQRYPVQVFRYQEKRRAGESRVVAGQGYVRLDRCSRCLLEEFCPGLHQSLVPQDRLYDIIRDSITLPRGTGEVWLAGTELLAPHTLTRLLSWLRRDRGFARIRLYHGGDSVAGDDFLPAAVRGGLTDLSLVYSGLEQGSTDLTTVAGGNAVQLAGLLSSPLLAPNSGLRAALAVPYVAADDDSPFDRLAPFARQGQLDLEVQLPANFKNPQIHEFLRLSRWFLRWRRAGGRDAEVVLPADRPGTPFFRHPMRLLAHLTRASAHHAPHFFASRQAGWVCLSQPPFARGIDVPMSAPILAGLPGTPIDQNLLERMRPG